MNKLNELIAKVEYDVNDFKNPMTYQDDKYYADCEAKLGYAEEILVYLKEMKAEKGAIVSDDLRENEK